MFNRTSEPLQFLRDTSNKVLLRKEFTTPLKTGKNLSNVPHLYQFILACFLTEEILYQEPIKGFVSFIQSNANIKKTILAN